MGRRVGGKFLVQNTNEFYLSSLHVAEGGSESAPCAGSNGKEEVNKICRDPGSNRGPSDLQSNALPTELSRHITLLNEIIDKYSRRVEGELVLTNVAEGLKSG
jgi:hypothetical protein